MSKLKIKTVFAALAAILVFVVPYAEGEVVFVSGDVSGVWSADSVIVTDSVRIPSGQTLTIMPGVEVLFTSYYKFEVRIGSVLHAVGTEDDSISFRPFTPGDRTLGLDFFSSSSQTILEYCHITDALTSAIHCANSDITIRNCLIENCEAPTGSMGGGGIELLVGSNPIIENNVIRNNYSAGAGGGIYCSAASPIISGNLISGNVAGDYGNASGGGIACFNGSNPMIMNNRILNNEARPVGSFSVRHGYGGGVYISNSSGGVLNGNIISGNVVNAEPQTTSDGGGIYLYTAYVTVSNNLITSNSAEGNDGGGINMYASIPTLVNNTIAYNMAGGLGGAVYAEFSTVDLVNSILYFNQDSLGTQIYDLNSNMFASYCDIQGTYPGIGNIDLVPMFRDPFGGDFHLQDSTICGDDFYSPCIDAGSPDYSDSLIDCSYGRGTEVSDMGVYGGGLFSPTGIRDDLEIIPSRFGLTQNYPNPFNAVTAISYGLTEPTDIKIDIFDALGRKVDVLYEGIQDAGMHDITWDASAVPSGIYFYRIQAGDYYESRKMLLLK